MRGATTWVDYNVAGIRISIHAPHAGRDYASVAEIATHLGFQSTRPMRGATSTVLFLLKHLGISIHAPHAGRDVKLPNFI